MESSALYAEQLMNQFESRFASADFANRVSYLSGLKRRLRRSRRIDAGAAASLRRRIESSVLFW